MPRRLLELSRELIRHLPDSPLRCRLFARNAMESMRVGDAELAKQDVTAGIEGVCCIERPIDRGFTQIELAYACIDCGLIELARSLLQDAESIFRAEKEGPGMTSFLLYLTDGIVRLGDLNWGLAIAVEESKATQVEILSGFVKRSAMKGLWKQALLLLQDERLALRRKALSVETLIFLSQANIDPEDHPRIEETIREIT